jgi:hypothetical protein
MPSYFRFGFGPFRFSQRLGRTPAQRRRAAAKRERESRRAAQENAKHVMGEVSGYYADASVVKFCIEDWINPRTLQFAVPRDQASPELWDTLAKVRDGAVAKADVPAEPGSSGTGDVSCIWNADGTPGPDADGSPEMTPASWDNPAYSGFRRWAGRVREMERLEEAKQSGHLLLGDGEVSAWHGVTTSGRQCHHRHRSPEAASECAARLQQQESG